MTACSSASLLRVVNLKIHNESGPFGLAGGGDEGQKIEILVVNEICTGLISNSFKGVNT